MKGIMISIQPKWVEKICHKISEENGKPIYEKRIEVRKDKPKKVKVPFKCYIYCTMRKPYLYKEANGNDLFLDSALYRGNTYEDRFLSGKVIGDFTCDRISKYPYEHCTGGEHLIPYDDFEQLAMDGIELYDYLRVKDGYGWHISDLKIYNKPKELNEFTPICKYKNERCEICNFYVEAFGGCCRTLKRPPQSWYYVEEL